MTRAVILGSGMVGTTMVADLASTDGFEVSVADARMEVLQRTADAYGVGPIRADLGDPDEVRRVVADFDIVLGALPSVLGLQTLRAVIEAGKHYVDISFMAEDPRQLHELAAENGVIAVVDCGVAPGVSNMMAGYASTQLDPCERIEMFVGGLPAERRWPFGYKAGFAPHDVIEEYVRPARYVEYGHVVVREALSEPELIDFPAVGTLEAFNTDGLRSLATSLDVPFMREKTLRYPGHIELMRAFRETGLFSKEPIEVGGVTVRPLDMTAALLFPKWTYEDGEPDLTVLRVVADGVRDGVRTRLRWHLHDVYDPITETRSMSRTTAFPATIMAGVIAAGDFPLGPGVYPPEYPAMHSGFLDNVLDQLEVRGVRCVGTVVELG